ncbi:MAG: hypothetical protein HQ495_06310 [Alphaproteobacteria bacterium]|nr:hypothetical protein [Alphaproteobacteria bacterium]
MQYLLPPMDAPFDIVQGAASLLHAHADVVARFGLGVAPTFKQELNRVIAQLDSEENPADSRPIEGVTNGTKFGL